VPALRLILILLLCLLCPQGYTPGHAGEERFDYDELGRLLRVVDEQGRSTLYRYDAVGNLLAVEVDGAASPPEVPPLPELTLRPGGSIDILLPGSSLAGAQIHTSDPRLRIENLRYTADGLSFTLTADATLPPGTYTISFETASGTVTFEVTVNPPLPTLTVVPTPVALPPDGASRPVAIRISQAGALAQTIALSVSDPEVVRLDADAVTIPAGERQATVGMAGLREGQANFTLYAPGIEALVQVPVYVTTAFAGVNTSFSPLLGVQRESALPPPEEHIEGLAAANVGIAFGRAVLALEPTVLPVGSDAVPLTISGIGLTGATAVDVVPADGIMLGGFEVDSQGRTVSLPMTVAESAATGVRRVRVFGADGRIIQPASPQADRLRIIDTTLPVVESITPINIIAGATAQLLTVRGYNFQGASSVMLHPSDHVSMDAAPTVNGEGTQLTVRLSVAPNAALGPRVLTVSTANGSSDATPGPSNTLYVILETEQDVTALVSPLVGVLRESGSEPEPTPGTLASPMLGVNKGAVVTALEPKAASVGADVTFTIHGVGLPEAATVDVFPPDGITLTGEITTAPDRRSVSVPVNIAADAAQTPRRLRLYDDGQAVPLASADANRFLVTATGPVLESVAPTHLVVGTPATSLLLRGYNLQQLQSVRIEPADDVVVGVPNVNAAGTEIAVNVAVGASAAAGPRVIQVVTAGGSTSLTPGAENTVQLVVETSEIQAFVASPVLGVTKGSSGETEIPVGPIAAPLVGVMKGEDTDPGAADYDVRTPLLGVAVGPIATGIQPLALLPGETVTLTVEGHGLPGVTQIGLIPADDLEVAPDVDISPEGDTVQVLVTAAPQAVPGSRRVVLQTETGTVPFADPSAARLFIGHGVPVLHSIEPILGGLGTTFELLVRGEMLFDATAVIAEPAVGIAFGSAVDVNGDGTQLTVPMHIAPDAPLGSRVIRVVVPGAISSGAAHPSNTFTVYESVP
jgi:YD repeat-containing protein